MSKNQLTPFEIEVIEHKGTERPFSGLYVDSDMPGQYRCKKCSAPLYRSQDKFHSGCGWPSFDDAIEGAIERRPDADGQRVEIVCNNCGGHLGHVFKGENFSPKNERHCVNSVALNFEPEIKVGAPSVVLASGCFWGTQYYLSRVPGVLATRVGYCGGHVEQPSYKQVCAGNTGHVEAVEISYDQAKVDLAEVVRVYFESHDFSQTNGQGPDIGSQYLSVLFYASDAEKILMQSLIAELRGMGHEVASKLEPAHKFWPAEDYHQHYYESKGDVPYCHRYRKIFERS